MAKDPNCQTCKNQDELRAHLAAAKAVAEYPFLGIIQGLLALLWTEENKHGEQHLIRCVTGADGND